MDNYNPKNIENKWYEFWDKNRFFSPDLQKSNKTFSIVIPPPNVTGYLHIGHALVNTLQDVIVRRKRMQGYKTLWLPGTDHAGIATQMVVDRELRKKGQSRESLGREKFIEEVWKWKEQSGNVIYKQLRSLGATLDWEREHFTLDEDLSEAVKKTFCDLYKEGLIYRGNYIVNWCPDCKTALSDLEVNHNDMEGSLTHIGYPLENGNDELVVATTRPETMLGDTAVAVNPRDERYNKYVGLKVRLPLTGRLIPIVADDFVDMEFGTGAVKVTPAHDPNDFQIAKRHNLPSINIFTHDAKINNAYPPLEGQDRFTARKNVLESLKQEGFFRKTDSHHHSVGSCQRCATIVEPRQSTQWFCSMKDMADQSLKAMEEGEIRFIPDHQAKIFREWMTNIQDWCLSRQIWWGHQIPAWYCDDCEHITVTEKKQPGVCGQCGSTHITQETDVLDTWFSSGLFPFSTMGWPKNTQDFKDFYPNSILITGYDILFFWVARMIMLGIKQTGELPFKEVFLHGLVRDESGIKMSKTKGNVIDPLVIIEKFGSDAMRFSLTSLTSMGKDIKLPEQAIEINRNFINKLWNATRFAHFHKDRLGEPVEMDQVNPGLFDQWILQRLNYTVYTVNRDLNNYRFDEASRALYNFIWKELCDWYLEIIKPILFEKLGKEAQTASFATLFYCLEKVLRLLHPIMPFVTEELWQQLPNTGKTIMLADYPKESEELHESLWDADSIIELISLIRNIRGENLIKPTQEIEVVIVSSFSKLKDNIKEFDPVFRALVKIKDYQLTESFTEKEGFASAVGKEFEVFVNLAGSIDVENEIKRLTKEQSKLEQKKDQIQKKLNNPEFLAKAPNKVIAKNKEELEDVLRKVNKIQINLNTIR